jgi:hypothetical protein
MAEEPDAARFSKSGRPITSTPKVLAQNQVSYVLEHKKKLKLEALQNTAADLAAKKKEAKEQAKADKQAVKQATSRSVTDKPKLTADGWEEYLRKLGRMPVLANPGTRTRRRMRRKSARVA